MASTVPTNNSPKELPKTTRKCGPVSYTHLGCRYLQFDDTSWGEFCSEEKRAGYIARGFDMDRLEQDYVSMINEALSERPVDMTVAMHICRGNFRSTWFSSGDYEPVVEILFGNTKVDGFSLEYDSDRAGAVSYTHLS